MFECFILHMIFNFNLKEEKVMFLLNVFFIQLLSDSKEYKLKHVDDRKTNCFLKC